MKQLLTMLVLIGSIAGLSALSLADTIPWFRNSSGSLYTSGARFNGLDLTSVWEDAAWMSPEVDSGLDAPLIGSLNMTGASAFSMCRRSPSVCVPEGRLDTMMMLTDPTTLIGHLTLEEYASLAEIATVTEMYLTEGTLTVKFFGGAWPGSLLSVFQTTFLL